MRYACPPLLVPLLLLTGGGGGGGEGGEGEFVDHGCCGGGLDPCGCCRVPGGYRGVFPGPICPPSHPVFLFLCGLWWKAFA